MALFWCAEKWHPGGVLVFVPELFQRHCTLHPQKPVAIHIKDKGNDKKMHKVQTFNYLNLTPEVVNKYHNHGEMIIVWQRVLELNFIE